MTFLKLCENIKVIARLWRAALRSPTPEEEEEKAGPQCFLAYAEPRCIRLVQPYNLGNIKSAVFEGVFELGQLRRDVIGL